MGGLDDEAAKQEKIRNKARFNESIKKYKGDIDVIDKRIKLMEKDIRTKKDALNGYRHVIIANEYLKIIGLYCAMNDESVQIMNFKNENYLNEARKLIYQVLIHLEDVVTPHIDIPPNDLEDKLEAIAKLNPQRKLNLLNAIGFRIQQVVDAVEKRRSRSGGVETVDAWGLTDAERSVRESARQTWEFINETLWDKIKRTWEETLKDEVMARMPILDRAVTAAQDAAAGGPDQE